VLLTGTSSRRIWRSPLRFESMECYHCGMYCVSSATHAKHVKHDHAPAFRTVTCDECFVLLDRRCVELHKRTSTHKKAVNDTAALLARLQGAGPVLADGGNRASASEGGGAGCGGALADASAPMAAAGALPLPPQPAHPSAVAAVAGAAAGAGMLDPGEPRAESPGDPSPVAQAAHQEPGGDDDAVLVVALAEEEPAGAAAPPGMSQREKLLRLPELTALALPAAAMAAADALQLLQVSALLARFGLSETEHQQVWDALRQLHCAKVACQLLPTSVRSHRRRADKATSQAAAQVVCVPAYVARVFKCTCCRPVHRASRLPPCCPCPPSVVARRECSACRHAAG